MQLHSRKILGPIKKNIFAEKLAFLTQSKARICKHLIGTFVFEQTPFFSPKIDENRRK
jgi:hypothetical protein